MQSSLMFFVNGNKIEESSVDPEWTLAYYLRSKRNEASIFSLSAQLLVQLTGTKLACEEGQCGSCTVVLGRRDGNTNLPRYGAVNACLFPLYAVHDCAVITVEGIGSTRSSLHPVQERLAAFHGSQCGFCTPGFVMSFYALLRNNPKPTAQEIDNALQGNLCRCTGYRPILESFCTFAENGCGIANCCKNRQSAEASAAASLTNFDECKQYEPSQDLIFPPELLLSDDLQKQSLQFTGQRVCVLLPSTLADFCSLLKDEPSAQVVGSATIVGLIARTNPSAEKSVWLSTSRVKELQAVSIENGHLQIGSACTLADLQSALSKCIAQLPAEHSRVMTSLLKNLDSLFSAQLRNLATWAGNVASGSSISDLIMPLFAAECELEVVDSDMKSRCISINADFFPSDNRKINLQKGEIIKSLKIGPSCEKQYVQTYKQGMRSGSDSAVVNAAFLVGFSETGVLEKCRLIFGGMSKKPFLVNTASFVGRRWEESLLKEVSAQLCQDLALPVTAPGGKTEYRTTLCLSFWLKFFCETAKWLRSSMPKCEAISLDATLAAVTEQTLKRRCEIRPTQIIQGVPSGQLENDAVGRPIEHQYGRRHTTGEAIYCDDIAVADAGHAVLVLSTRAHANILSVDATEALQQEGILDYIDANDIPSGGTNYPRGNNRGTMDRCIFAEKEVTAVGQTIGCVVGESVDVARRAAKLVKVVYEDLPHTVTLQDAIARGESLADEMECSRGDAKTAMGESELVLEGEVAMGGQQHVYMENQTALVEPGEGQEWRVVSSTQDAAQMQTDAAAILALSAHSVVVSVKRLGGGFGGKCDQSCLTLWPALVAASKLRRPIKCTLSRKDDFLCTGGRHPIICNYKVGFKRSGEVSALTGTLYSNGGNWTEESALYAWNAARNVDSGYDIDGVQLVSQAMQTNLQSNTAFRGAGQPQGHFVAERIVERVAHALHMPAHRVREMNLTKVGSQKCSGDVVHQSNLRRCWDEAMRWSKFELRRNQVDEFNSCHRWIKRGISLIPVHFPCGMPKAYEQGAALVHIYTDGSVQVAIGGIEMGQGLNTKCLQIASRVFRLPIDRITILDNATDKVPNAIVSGGSQGSDVHGKAVKDACEALLHRLEGIMAENPKGSWEGWIKKAFTERISLSATGFATYKKENETLFGVRYYTSGVACTEVEIDCLTGDHQLLGTDIVMDVGDTLNPAVDIGQIEGAFVQGCGLYTLEELTYGPGGEILTDSLGKYKIPTATTIPREFRVALMTGVPTKDNIYSSKAIGEPPFALGTSAYFAISDAINSARKDAGERAVWLDSPLTADRIRMACHDAIAQSVMNK